ncbi:MAG TPA: CCA tRNA nucleotidyltransferase [Candidatus Sumerlaeota bacterium]|nr:CCA tRNA nucleotidyltransferase [Candidatus Sumerlaeota bacterium]
MYWDLNSPVLQSARRVVERLREAGYEACWVGGCVRDALLGLPGSDVDVATDAPPDRVQALFPHTVPVGVSFGVVLVVEGNVRTEVATFRQDGQYLDARRPESVTFGSARQDAQRRDFTLNALFYDPIEEQVRDFVGGQADLEARVLRTVGDPRARFHEDALRLLRAVRFTARFDLTIEPATDEALREMAPRIQLVSAERIRDELVKIFTGPHPGTALRLLDACGLLSFVLPEVAAGKGVAQPPNYHPEGDVFEHTALTLEFLPERPSATLAIAALLHDIGKPPTYQVQDRIRFPLHAQEGAEMARAVCRRLKFSNAERKQIVSLVANHMRFIDVQNMRRSRLRRFVAEERFDEHLALHYADCMSSNRNLDNHAFCVEARAEFASHTPEAALPPPLLSGYDLLTRGYPEGPHLGDILRAVREAQLDDTLRTREEALDWVAEHWPLEPGEKTS